jgi:AraC-binding-like domain
MQRLVFSTDDVLEADRFSYWREAFEETLIGVSGERDGGRETPFAAAASGTIGPSFARVRLRADGHPVFRRPCDIARRGWDDHVLLCREGGVGSRFNHGGREFLTEPDDLIILDPTIPFVTETRRKFDQDVWFFPRNLLDPHLSVSQRPHALVLAKPHALKSIAKAYLDAFAEQIDVLEDQAAGFIADNFCRLLAVACGGDPPGPARGGEAPYQSQPRGPQADAAKSRGRAEDLAQAIAPSVRAERRKLRAICPAPAA